MNWMNFADAEEQTGDLIPHKTPVKVVMKIRAGGHNDSQQGWSGGYATMAESGAVYLDCEFTVMGGKYNKRKIWSLIGLHSPKGPKWAGMGRSFIRAALESARGVAPSDTSERAMSARQINGLGDLDGLEFAAFVDVQKAEEGSGYSDKNVIQNVIPATHKDYRAIMSGEAVPQGAGATSQAAFAPPPAASSKPAWAQ